MSVRITLHTAARVLRQVRHDRRTIVLLLVVPALLQLLMKNLSENDQADTFDSLGIVMLGVFPFIAMFLVTSIAMLRERTAGTLERLLTTPLHKPDLLLGYGLAFALAAAVQAAVATAVTFWLLDLNWSGNPWTIGALAIENAVLGMAIGLFLSAFARTEFQAVQFMPAFVLPQLMLCGLFWPRDTLTGWLRQASDVLPMTYAVDSLTQVRNHAGVTGQMWRDVAVVAGSILLVLALGAATLRRRTS